MMESPAQSSSAPAGPDWLQITHDVHCPLCEYNLRGIREPRCPECGYRFEWEEVLNPRRAEHPYLFEHHPRHNIWSWWRTLIGSWWPSTFFQSLHPTQKSRVGRMMIFWALGGVWLMLSCVLSGLSVLAVFAQHLTTWGINRYGYAVPGTALTFDNMVTAWLSREWPEYLHTVLIPIHLVIPFAWPWLTLAALLIFRVSMRRAKIRTVHVLRCAIYSFDPVFVAICFVLADIPVFLSSGPLGRGPMRAYYFWLDYSLLILVAFSSWGTYRLWKGYRYYLRFDHPCATVVACQILVWLMMIALISIFVPRLIDLFVARSIEFF